MRAILLTGKNGQIGWELHRVLPSLGSVIATDRKALDLADASAVRKTVRERYPGVIINAAACTAVDKAEENESLATIVNGSSVGTLADEAKKLDALLIHYSTDHVFDGSKPTPYAEDDEPCPVNAYGRSKLLGEERIRQSGCDYLILRTSWVYASRGHNFVRTILQLAKERQELDIINDQVGAPTWAHDIAESSADIVRQALREREQGNFVSGIFNLTSAG